MKKLSIIKKIVIGVLPSQDRKKIKAFEDGVRDAEDKNTFFWSFIESEIRKQPLENLLRLRKLINKNVVDRLRKGNSKNE